MCGKREAASNQDPPKVGPRLRYQVIALGREQGGVEASPSGQLGAQSAAGSSGGAPGRRTSSRWASLIARIYDVLPLVCLGAPREAWSRCFDEHHRLRHRSRSRSLHSVLPRSPHPIPSTVCGSGAAGTTQSVVGHLRVRSDRRVRPRRSGTHSRPRFARCPRVRSVAARLRHRPTHHGPAVPDAGSDPFGISCPSTHPLVTSLMGER